MRQPLQKYKNNLLNTLTIVYWISINCGALCLMLTSDLINSFSAVIVLGSVVLLCMWPIKRYQTSIYKDTIVFKETGWHPLVSNIFGFAFENIVDYKIERIGAHLNWIVLKGSKNETFRRLASLSKKELLQLESILDQKINR